MLSTINLFIALIIVAVFAFLGNVYLPKAGAIFGAIIGFAVASIICGVLAALCLIEKHLRVVADDVKKRQKASTHGSPVQRTAQAHQARTEPVIG
ncbi:hypothetical protein [Mesorhizobium sp. LNHC232B00]|uniref:hypothetical protein n=2 Tax=Mesorhizobium TaxID=68287 RepID=UPI0004CEDECD|nr:hypothetical protein [Mesorhizobium sp. LNHC232B00]